MRISAASPSPNFCSGKSYVKNNSVYFSAICVNCPHKIWKFELEVAGMGILGTEFCFPGSHNMSCREITAKRVTPISFLCLINLKTVLL